MVGIDPVLAKGDLESGRIAQRREWGVSATLLAYMRENWKHRKRMDRPARLLVIAKQKIQATCVLRLRKLFPSYSRVMKRYISQKQLLLSRGK
jgi:hypothetical protein